MNEIVKYDNILNEIRFENFSENDFNFFMCICSRMRDLDEEVQVFDYSYLMDLVEWDKSQRLELFHQEVKRMTSKLRKIGGTYDVNQDEFETFNLFSTFRGNKAKKTLTVRVNPDLKYILNDLTKNFTRFELKEYVRLSGRYSKMLYQHLKQYYKTGWWQVSIGDIRNMLSIPFSYQNKHVMDKVIKPSIDVVKSCEEFSDLTVEVLKSSNRGRAVEGYKFKWTVKQVKGQRHINDIKNSKKTKKIKNKFNNFPQNDYDFEKLEQELISN